MLDGGCFIILSSKINKVFYNIGMGKKKLEIEFIRSEFEKEGYILLTKEYKNCSQKLEYICPKGHEHSISRDNWKAGHRCTYCNGGKRLAFNFVKKSFMNENYILLSDVYINSEEKLEYICSLGHKHSMKWNNWNSGKRCPECGIVKQALQVTGKNHYNWKGGITKFNKELRNFVKKIGWTSDVFKRDNYTCCKCGIRGSYLIAHHIIPLSTIRKEFKINNLKDAEKCELIYDVSNGVTLCRDCHKLIHDKFYIRRNLVLCLKKELQESLNGLYEPFVREILRRNPSNSGKALTLKVEGNPEQSPTKGNVQRSVETRRLQAIGN